MRSCAGREMKSVREKRLPVAICHFLNFGGYGRVQYLSELLYYYYNQLKSNIFEVVLFYLKVRLPLFRHTKRFL